MWVWAAMGGCGDGSGNLAVALEVRPGIHDLVAVAGGAEADRVRWRWTVDGAETDHDTNRVPAEEVWPGQRWTAAARLRGTEGTATVDVPEPPGGNVLLVIIDDVGVEKLGVYGAPDAPPTPTIDALAERGVVFRNAWASPTCTPTRSELLTGRHAARTGVGAIIDMDDSPYELPLAAWTLPELLAGAHGPEWDTSAIGKWHLSSLVSPSNHRHPLLQGFGWYAGSLGYLVQGSGDIDGYFRWVRTSGDGETALCEVYNTTSTVDDALDRIEAMPEPFLVWVAFNAPHTPLHVPPAELHTSAVEDTSGNVALHAAMLESVDTELGRLFTEMDPAVLADTTVMLIADNGTSHVAVAPPLSADRVKGTLYEGGVRVPLIVAGPHVVAPGVSDALVRAVDLFATVAEIGGVPLGDDPTGRLSVGIDGESRAIDGRSLLPWLADPDAPGPQTVYAEQLYPNGPPPWLGHGRVVRDARYKILRDLDGDHLFALDPARVDDGPDLLGGGPIDDEAWEAWARLGRDLDRRGIEVYFEGF